MVDQDEPKVPAKRPRKYNSKFRQGKSSVPATRHSMSAIWKGVLERMGGRDGIRDAALASQNPKAVILADLLGDRSYAHHTVDTLAKKSGLNRADVVAIFQERQSLLTTISIYESLPEIVADAATDAKASYLPCEECKGVVQTPPCYACGGSGKVRKPGDKEKLAFIGEAAGIVGKKGPLVQVNTQINNSSGAGKSFEELMRAASVNETPRKAIDGVKEAEIVSTSDETST